MDLDRLREVQSRERESQSLQPLEDSFYGDAAEFVMEKEDERDSLDDPSSAEAQRLNDVVVSARRFAESVYERRVGKIVNMASLAANGTKVEKGKLTEEERQLFDEVEAAIAEHGERVMDVLEGHRGQQELVKDSNPDSDADAADAEVSGDTSSGSGSGGEGVEPSVDDTGSESSLEGYTTVRLTEDVPAFVGTDGEEYELSEEDVATVPEKNARVLCEKDAAEEIERES